MSKLKTKTEKEIVMDMIKSYEKGNTSELNPDSLIRRLTEIRRKWRKQ